MPRLSNERDGDPGRHELIPDRREVRVVVSIGWTGTWVHQHGGDRCRRLPPAAGELDGAGPHCLVASVHRRRYGSHGASPISPDGSLAGRDGHAIVDEELRRPLEPRRRFGDREPILRPTGVTSHHGWPSGSADLEASWLSVQGKVKFFDPDRGFGFISREGGDDVFVHVSNLQADGAATLAEGQLVEFEIGPGRKGDEARNVHAV